MSYANLISRKIVRWINRRRLRNKTFSLFSSNCNGCCICHDLGLQFRSPFVNLYLSAEDYMRFLRQPKRYLAMQLTFCEEQTEDYPVGQLDDITLHFVHYATAEEATQAWERRKARIDWDNLFVLMSDRDGCTEEMLQEFDALPYKNKVVFTHVPMPHIQSAAYIPGFETEAAVGNCDAFVNNFSGKKYFDYFNYVKWFNEGK